MSNHSGDTNKMVSDTPRTDACLEYYDTTVDDVKDFARQLEREINSANSEVYRLCKANLQLREGAEEQKQRIKRLEESGDAMMSEPCEYTFEQWIKAKEAKL